jgi:hypothetical protein
MTGQHNTQDAEPRGDMLQQDEHRAAHVPNLQRKLLRDSRRIQVHAARNAEHPTCADVKTRSLVDSIMRPTIDEWVAHKEITNKSWELDMAGFFVNDE